MFSPCFPHVFHHPWGHPSPIHGTAPGAARRSSSSTPRAPRSSGAPPAAAARCPGAAGWCRGTGHPNSHPSRSSWLTWILMITDGTANDWKNAKWKVMCSIPISVVILYCVMFWQNNSESVCLLGWVGIVAVFFWGQFFGSAFVSIYFSRLEFLHFIKGN